MSASVRPIALSSTENNGRESSASRAICQALWHDPATPARERKRILRLMIDDVTLTKVNEITVQVRFRGGATHTLSLPRPLPAWKVRQLDPDLIAEIDRLIGEHTDAEIATIRVNAVSAPTRARFPIGT